MMEFEKVTLDIDDNGVAVMSLNDPDALNAVSAAMLRGMSDALREVERPSNGARAFVLTGTGRGFCAGANLADSEGTGGRANAKPEDRDAGEALELGYHPVLQRMMSFDMPMITAVNGPAAGVGMAFAIMGDIVVATESSYLLQAFTRIGLVPDGGSTYLLPRIVGMRRAVELSMLAEKLPAKQALEWGLVSRVVADGEALNEAKAIATRLAKGPTRALGLTRKLYQASLHNSYAEQLQMEREAQRTAGRTNDFTEGVMALLQKRPAEFKGE